MDLPPTIRVSGSYYFWNGVYHKIDDVTYRLNRYKLWGIIDIPGVTISKDDVYGWEMEDDVNPYPIYRKLLSEQQDTPVGKWEDGVEIKWGSIVVSGLPFMLQGWNNKYLGQIDGSYYLPPYKLYGIISIRSVRIREINGIWTILDNHGSTLHFNKIGIDQSTPVGRWNKGIKVKWC